MPKEIPVVRPELLFKAVAKANEDREKFGSPDVAVSTVMALANDCLPGEISAVSFRLTALAGLISQGEGRAWTIKLKDKEYTLVNDALFRAAARAPLFEAPTVGEISFDPETFLPIALEEAKDGGRA